VCLRDEYLFYSFPTFMLYNNYRIKNFDKTYGDAIEQNALSR